MAVAAQSSFLEGLASTHSVHRILVYKTNISDAHQRFRVLCTLKSIAGVEHCWVDIDDCDCVLRVVGTFNQTSVENAVYELGYLIEEL